MKRILLLMLVISFALPARARPVPSQEPRLFDEVADWAHFDRFMQEENQRDRQLGWSYVISGALVTVGGLLGSHSATDTGTQLVLGVSTSLGLAATAYGSLRLMNGNDYSNFYETLRQAHLSRTQRDEMVSIYIAEQKDREHTRQITGLVTHLVAGGLNLYSASQQKDNTAKGFLQFFAAVNFALAVSYTF